MKNLGRLSREVLALGFLTLLTHGASAAIIVGKEDSTTAGAFDSVSNTDLVNQGQPTLLGTVDLLPIPFFGANAVNNGVSANNTVDSAFWFAFQGPTPTMTFLLDTTSNPLGYNLTQIRTVAGWFSAVDSQANQTFELLVRPVGTATFNSLGTFSHTPFQEIQSGGDYLTRITITDDTGLIASRVDAVRFIYTQTSTGTPNPGLVIREIDIEGDAVNAGSVTQLISNVATSMVQIIHDLDVSGGNGMAAKLDGKGKGGVLQRVVNAANGFETGMISHDAYVVALLDSLDKLQSFDNQLAEKIANGQIVDPEATSLLAASNQIRDWIEDLRSLASSECPCWTDAELPLIADGVTNVCGDEAMPGDASISGFDSVLTSRFEFAVIRSNICDYQQHNPRIIRSLGVTDDEASSCRTSILNECAARGL